MKFALNKKNSKKPAEESAENPDSDSPMDLNLLERLVKLMAANDLNTVDLRDGDKRVILKRGALSATTTIVSAPAAATPAVTAPANPTAPAQETENLIAIKSPMVGTYYAAASPDAKPFVSVGTHVDEETDVCVIEAMKVFNNIKAECRGTIVRILVNNGQTVEYGQPLFHVKSD